MQSMVQSEYIDQRLTRTLRDVVNPKVRAAALWIAHAMMATCNIAAADGKSGRMMQERQTALLQRVSPTSRQWLGQRQAFWPPEYRRLRCIDISELS